MFTAGNIHRRIGGRSRDLAYAGNGAIYLPVRKTRRNIR